MDQTRIELGDGTMEVHITNSGDAIFDFIEKCEENNFNIDKTFRMKNSNNDMIFIFKIPRELESKIFNIKAKIRIFHYNTYARYSKFVIKDIIETNELSLIPEWISTEILNRVTKNRLRNKTHYEKNHVKLLKYVKDRMDRTKFICDCKSKIQTHSIKQHKKTQKHQTYLASL